MDIKKMRNFGFLREGRKLQEEGPAWAKVKKGKVIRRYGIVGSGIVGRG